MRTSAVNVNYNLCKQILREARSLVIFRSVTGGYASLARCLIEGFLSVHSKPLTSALTLLVKYQYFNKGCTYTILDGAETMYLSRLVSVVALSTISISTKTTRLETDQKPFRSASISHYVLCVGKKSPRLLQQWIHNRAVVGYIAGSWKPRSLIKQWATWLVRLAVHTTRVCCLTGLTSSCN